MTHYIAVIHKEKTSDYGVSFPDFPGCITAGRTVDEAKDMAGEALQLHVEGMLEDGESLPVPTILDKIVAIRAYKNATAFFVVSINPSGGKAVRFNATMPESLLYAVDARAQELGLSRSGFLAKAAKNELGV